MSGVVIAATSRRPIGAADVLPLYRAEGWWAERRPVEIDAVLAEFPAVGAWDGARLVGFARAVSDGRFRAYIEDVVVAGEHRGRGIGARLIEALLAELEAVHVATLFCGEDPLSLYERVGFERTAQVVLHRRGP